MASSNQQILLAKHFSNILVNIMKLEDRFNQFEAQYIQLKSTSPKNKNGSNEFLDIENNFYTTFKANIKIQKQRISHLLFSFKQSLIDLRDTNEELYKKIIASNSETKLPNKNSSSKDIIKNNKVEQYLFFKILDQLNAGMNIEDVFSLYEEGNNYFTELINLNKNKNISSLNKIEDNDIRINILYILNAFLTTIVAQNLPTDLQPKIEKITSIIKNLVNLVLSPLNNTKLKRNKEVLIDEYKKNLASILAIFKQYNKYKTKKEVENFTNLVNNMSKPIKKHFNGLTITFAFVTRLLKYLVIKLINEKVSNSSSAAAAPASAAPPAVKNKPIYNPRKIELVHIKPNVDPIQIILMRPTITKGDIFRMLSSPETYKECRAKELGTGANDKSKIGEALFNNNVYKDSNVPIFYFEEGKSTADLFTNPFDKTPLKSRQPQNIRAEIGDKLWEQILDPQPNHQSNPQLILICEPSDIQKIFDINDFANANSIQKMPYASGIKVNMYVEDNEKFYFEKVAKLETKVSINGADKTLLPIDKDYVNNVKDWYSTQNPPINLSCDLGIDAI